MSIQLTWQKGNPTLSGLYFVAIRLGDGAGVYDFLNWSNGHWENLEAGNVIGFVNLQDFKNSLDIIWPEDTEIDYKPRNLEGEHNLWDET
jgi:hypothetical protein